MAKELIEIWCPECGVGLAAESEFDENGEAWWCNNCVEACGS
jgi:hypothetical protein